MDCIAAMNKTSWLVGAIYPILMFNKRRMTMWESRVGSELESASGAVMSSGKGGSHGIARKGIFRRAGDTGDEGESEAEGADGSGEAGIRLPDPCDDRAGSWIGRPDQGPVGKAEMLLDPAFWPGLRRSDA